MSKLLTILMAGAAALAINGVATAADDSGSSSAQNTQEQHPSPTKGKPDQHEADTGMPEAREGTSEQSAQNQSDQGQTGQSQSGQTAGQSDQSSGTAGQSAGQTGTQSEEYAQAIKKCESMTGSKREKCMQKAKKDHGQM